MFFDRLTNYDEKVNVESLNIDVPDLWQTEIPNSNQFTGDWWEIFDDVELEKFITSFQENSPDLQSIMDNKNIAYQRSKINSQWCNQYRS